MNSRVFHAVASGGAGTVRGQEVDRVVRSATDEAGPVPVPTASVTPAAPTRAARTFHLVAGWVLLVAWLAAATGMLLGGSVQATHEELVARLAADARAGETTTLQVSEPVPAFLERGAQGYGRIEVRWREGLLWHETAVVVASSDRQARAARREGHATAVVVAPETPEDLWRRTQPELVVEQTDWTYRGGSIQVWGDELHGPSWAVALLGVAWLGTLARLVVGQAPWRLTRWGWAWPLLLAWPAAIPAFLLLGGSTGLLEPSRQRRRLTGGESLALCLLAGLVVPLLATLAGGMDQVF